jgi:hypothetical protein
MASCFVGALQMERTRSNSESFREVAAAELTSVEGGAYRGDIIATGAAIGGGIGFFVGGGLGGAIGGAIGAGIGAVFSWLF